MKTDKTTKLLLAAIALGLFANAIVTFTAPAHGYGHRYQAFLIAGKARGQDNSPIVVECINCR